MAVSSDGYIHITKDKYTLADFDALVNTFSSDEGTPFKNGFAFNLIQKEKKNYTRAAKHLMDLLTKKNYNCSICSLGIKLRSLYNNVMSYKKNLTRNWTRLECFLGNMFVVPVPGKLKTVPVTETQLNVDSDPRPQMDVKVIKTECTKCQRLEKSLKETTKDLNMKLRDTIQKLRLSKDVKIKQIYCSLKRKHEIIQKLKRQQSSLQSKKILLTKELKKIYKRGRSKTKN